VLQKGRDFASHKFKKKSGVCYELAVGIMTGELKWINGPYPCGKYNDITIFRDSLVSFLDDFERVEADDGYEGESPLRCKIPKAVMSRPSEADAFQKRVQGRHETINSRFKAFAVLREMYRHDITQHGYVFRAVAVIVQLSIKNGDPLFSTTDYKCGF
jgi:hypothetical protein